jgi:hypothetical protein
MSNQVFVQQKLKHIEIEKSIAFSFAPPIYFILNEKTTAYGGGCLL